VGNVTFSRCKVSARGRLKEKSPRRRQGAAPPPQKPTAHRVVYAACTPTADHYHIHTVCGVFVGFGEQCGGG